MSSFFLIKILLYLIVMSSIDKLNPNNTVDNDDLDEQDNLAKLESLRISIEKAQTQPT